jgi:hypothetical protein
MNTKEAAEALLVALDTVDEVKAYRVGDNITPPGFVVGPPVLTFDSYCDGPTEARFVVWVVVDANSWSMDRLWELVPLAAAAINTVVDASVTNADPAVYEAGDIDLPAYSLLVPVALSS